MTQYRAMSENNPYESPANPDQTSVPAHGDHPALMQNRSYWGLTVAQFLGAFNDNLFKQIVMLLFVAVPVAGGGTKDIQWIATIVFSVPFVLFSGIAGYYSDRMSKRWVIFLCKSAEIGITLTGLAVFLLFAQVGLNTTIIVLLSVVLFGFGTQSAFFGPGKYGILPEIMEDRDLPSANGVIVMLTFVSIIFGMAAAGLLKDWFGLRLWIPGIVCVVIAVIGTIAAGVIRKTEPADPDLNFDRSALFLPNEIRSLLHTDRSLASALFVSCIFWMTASIVTQSVNAFGKYQLELESDAHISYLVATISLGIAIGAAICGWISKGQLKWSMLRIGATGIGLCLVAMSITVGGKHLLGYFGSLAALTLLGVFTGMFAIPLQVFLQARPPDELKGRMIASQNLLNWVAIILSGLIYFGFTELVVRTGLPRSIVFLLTSVFMICVAIFYRPTATLNTEPAKA